MAASRFCLAAIQRAAARTCSSTETVKALRGVHPVQVDHPDQAYGQCGQGGRLPSRQGVRIADSLAIRHPAWDTEKSVLRNPKKFWFYASWRLRLTSCSNRWLAGFRPVRHRHRHLDWPRSNENPGSESPRHIIGYEHGPTDGECTRRTGRGDRSPALDR
jgi:hypothetical protein